MPLLKNLADCGKWQSNNSSISITNGITGEVHTIGEGDGEITFNPYQGCFIDSYKMFQDSIEGNHHALFKASISEGYSAIESFIREKANDYNYLRNEKILVDNKSNKVSFYDKIDKWIPEMTGKKVDKGGREWDSLKQLIDFRDNRHIHVKEVYGIAYIDLLKFMNLYRYGIPGFLKQLHILFNLYIPSNIIRGSYFPDIELNEINND